MDGIFEVKRKPQETPAKKRTEKGQRGGGVLWVRTAPQPQQHPCCVERRERKPRRVHPKPKLWVWRERRVWTFLRRTQLRPPPLPLGWSDF